MYFLRSLGFFGISLMTTFFSVSNFISGFFFSKLISSGFLFGIVILFISGFYSSVSNGCLAFPSLEENILRRIAININKVPIKPSSKNKAEFPCVLKRKRKSFNGLVKCSIETFIF